MAGQPKVISLPLTSFHEQRRRRLGEESLPLARPSRYWRRLTPDANHSLVTPLWQGYGTHYVELWCGTPPQRQTLIVDTGSSTTGFPGSSCDDCGEKHHLSPFFNESLSSTFRRVRCDNCFLGKCKHRKTDDEKCKMEKSYQEGSKWQAYEASDICYLGNRNFTIAGDSGDVTLHPHNFAAELRFGVQTNLTGLFRTQLADGIMGLDMTRSSFWHQLWMANGIERRAFSMCYAPLQPAKRAAGVLTLGGTDTRLHKTTMVYTKHSGLEGSGYYDVRIRKVYLEGVSSAPKVLELSADELNNGEAIIDSGTTDTFFSGTVKEEFERVFQEVTGRKYSSNFVKMSRDEVNALPTMIIQIVGDELRNSPLGEHPLLATKLDPDHPTDLMLRVEPKHYMEAERTGHWSPRIQLNEEDGVIIGANSMMGHDILFDIEESLLGWAHSDCIFKGTPSPVAEAKAIKVYPQKQEESVSHKTGHPLPWIMFCMVLLIVVVARKKIFSGNKTKK